jgi:hypothetical protein
VIRVSGNGMEYGVLRIRTNLAALSQSGTPGVGSLEAKAHEPIQILWIRR